AGRSSSLRPQAQESGLAFFADFEGGNLRRVRLEDTGAVEVLLCGDTGRRSHSQWFFFDVVTAQSQELRLHIVTFRKEGSTFSDGQRVVMLPFSGDGEGSWRRAGHSFCYVTAWGVETDTTLWPSP
ncbi:unnamed protein product, partial [Polarella glacialis]